MPCYGDAVIVSMTYYWTVNGMVLLLEGSCDVGIVLLLFGSGVYTLPDLYYYSYC